MKILLFVIDCMRADYVQPDICPFIYYLSQEYYHFPYAFTSAPYTPASFGSMYTGMYPYAHGITKFLGKTLNKDLSTISELVSKKGIETASFIGAHPAGKAYGLHRGFNYFDDKIPNNKHADITIQPHKFRRNCRIITDSFLEWEKGKNNYFASIHYFDLHSPYGKGQIPKIAYKNRLGSIDKCIHEILFTYRMKNAEVFIVADHGEGLGDKEATHRRTLYNQILRIPFIWKPSGMVEISDQKLISNIDIFPTILDSLGIKPKLEYKLHGKSLYEREGHNTVYSETNKTANNRIRCIQSKEWKYVLNNESREVPLNDCKEYSKGDRNQEIEDKLMADFKNEFGEIYDWEEKDEVTKEQEKIIEDLKGLGYL